MIWPYCAGGHIASQPNISFVMLQAYQHRISAATKQATDEGGGASAFGPPFWACNCAMSSVRAALSPSSASGLIGSPCLRSRSASAILSQSTVRACGGYLVPSYTHGVRQSVSFAQHEADVEIFTSDADRRGPAADGEGAVTCVRP